MKKNLETLALAFFAAFAAWYVLPRIIPTRLFLGD